MMKTLQKLGKSLMLPVACLPVAAILMGIGYWFNSLIGHDVVVFTFMQQAGLIIIDNMAILFAIGVAVGMSDDGEGTSALAGLVSWLMVTKLLSPAKVAMFMGIKESAVDPAFGKIENAFIGILCGCIAAFCYNRFKNTKLPDFLSFFSGKRSVAIVTAGLSILVTLILFFAWPFIYGALTAFGEKIISLGAVGAGIYVFLNRLLIPFGLHHALNNVFWFDVAGIDDIAKFWGNASGGEFGTTGMYMTGFFPVMMFGVPAIALAIYHSAKKEKRKDVKGLLLSGGFSAFFTGITEPIEFSFMFLTPILYVVHALLAGISAFVCTLLPVRSGFNFSAGLIDWFLSFRAPMAQNPLMIIPIGLGFGVIYYIVFRIIIAKFNLKTPGREDDEDAEEEKKATLESNSFTEIAEIILEGLGGKENIASLDNCITRLRMEVKDPTIVNEKKIKSAGVAGVIRPGKTSVQVVIGTKVQFVADEMKKLL